MADEYVFDLVPVDVDAAIATDQFAAARYRLLEFQPARSVELVGTPARAIRVVALGGADVAPGLLDAIEEPVGTRLRVVPRGS